MTSNNCRNARLRVREPSVINCPARSCGAAAGGRKESRTRRSRRTGKAEEVAFTAQLSVTSRRSDGRARGSGAHRPRPDFRDDSRERAGRVSNRGAAAGRPARLRPRVRESSARGGLDRHDSSGGIRDPPLSSLPSFHPRASVRRRFSKSRARPIRTTRQPPNLCPALYRSHVLAWPVAAESPSRCRPMYLCCGTRCATCSRPFAPGR